MKKILLTCFMLVFVLYAWAQDRTVSGKVTDAESGEGLPGVNVLLKGTGTGVNTDLDGNYKLSVPSEGGTLVFSFIGMAKQEVQIGARSVVDAQLVTDVQQLSEVIVTGYRPVTKEKSNISASQIDADKIENRPNSSFVQTLSGQVAGLNIATATGQPGAQSAINLRGINSINGSIQPLFVIDGIPANQANFRSINPNEIASITVLKDAGATAIYGNRGSNGVIVIETKRGTFNSPLEITYTGQYISSTLQDNQYNLLSSPQQLRLERERRAGRGNNGNEGFPMTDAQMDAVGTFDWADYFFNTGVGINHNLQLRKGGDNITSYLSFGYLDQEGILQNSGLERYNLRANITGRSDNKKFTYGVNISTNYSNSLEPNAIGTSGINQNYILGAYQAVPYLTDADYVGPEPLLSPLDFVNTPLFLIDRLKTFTREVKEIKGLGSINLGYEIIDGLSINSRTTADFEDIYTLGAQDPYSFNSLLFAEAGNNTPGFQDQQSNREFTYQQLTSINYGFTLAEKHTINVGLYNEYFRANLQSFGFRAQGLNPKTFDPGDGSGFVDDNPDNDFFVDLANANILNQSLLSFFGTIDYDYDSRFGLSGTLRRDASSRFFGSNKWGTFYSVAGRWNLSNEAFLEDVAFLEVLKLRASHGTNGNQAIGGNNIFASLDLYRPLFSSRAGYLGRNALGLSQIPNDAVRWETVTQSNIGLDAEFFRGRLRSVVDVYYKTTTDLFQSTLISAINATNAINGNTGELENKGIDLEMHYDIVRANQQGGLNITLDLVGNYNKNTILALPEGAEEQIGLGRVGGPLREYYDYRYAGVNPANGNLLFLTSGDGSAGPNGEAGGLNANLTESPNVDTDRVWLGKNVYPDYQGSFGLNVDYKGFFLSVQFNYIIGVDRYDFDYSGFMNPTSIGQFRNSNDILRAWTPDNTITDVPRLNAANLDLAGTRWLTNADYVRLRFSSIGYNFPEELLSKVGMRVGRIFVNGENLFTLSDWRGFDAEAQNNLSRRYPTPRTVTVGVEIGF